MAEPTTTLSLYNLHGRLHTVKLKEWENALNLAQQHGWSPAGIGRPPVSIDIDNHGDPSYKWEGAYDVPAGQTVHTVDAKALASALQDAARDIPAEPVVVEDGFRQDLNSLAKFCCSGSFIICTSTTDRKEDVSAGQETPEVTQTHD